MRTSASCAAMVSVCVEAAAGVIFDGRQATVTAALGHRHRICRAGRGAGKDQVTAGVGIDDRCGNARVIGGVIDRVTNAGKGVVLAADLQIKRICADRDAQSAGADDGVRAGECRRSELLCLGQLPNVDAIAGR